MRTSQRESREPGAATVSRRDALKLDSALLASAALPRGLRAAGSSPLDRPSAAAIPAGLNQSQREGVAGRTADLGNGQYLNPILAGDYTDPAVLKDGKDYHMSHSMCGGLRPGILVWHSRDLVNWEPVCRDWTHTENQPCFSGCHTLKRQWR